MARRVVALILLIAAGCSPSGDPVIRGTPTSPSPSPSPTDVALTHWTATAPPPETIVVARDGEIVLISSRDGHRIRIIASQADIKSDFVHYLSLSPDRKTVYFTRLETELCFEIMRVPISGGRLSRIAKGSSADVSLDGKTLAYSSSDNCGDRRQRVVTRDLVTGKERSWEAKRTEAGSYGDVKWAPDPRFLLVQSCGVDSCSPILLDTKRTDGVLAGPSYGPQPSGYDDSFLVDESQADVSTMTVRRPHGTLVFGVHYADEPENARFPIFEFDPRSGAIVTIVSGRPRVAPLDFDASGDHLIYVTPEGELFRYDGNTAVSLGTGFSGAAW
jgi:hypothetical protein